MIFHCEGCGHNQGYWAGHCPACGGAALVEYVRVSAVLGADLEAGECSDREEDSREEGI